MRNRAIRGCLIVVLAFSFILLENIGCVAKKSVEPHADTVQSQQISQADNRSTLEAPFIVKSIPTEKSQQEAEEDARDKNDKRRNDRVTIFTGIATAVILALQLFVFGWQAPRLKQTISTMKELGKKQSDDMRASIAVANDAALAANRSADVAENALIAGQGAFVFVKNCMFNGITDATTNRIIHWKVNVTWENSGQTPTRYLKLRINREAPPLRNSVLPDEFTFPDSPAIDADTQALTKAGFCVVGSDEITFIGVPCWTGPIANERPMLVEHRPR
jgi:hypothetical protein